MRIDLIIKGFPSLKKINVGTLVTSKTDMLNDVHTLISFTIIISMFFCGMPTVFAILKNLGNSLWVSEHQVPAIISTFKSSFKGFN
jgi:hypothetical protein